MALTQRHSIRAALLCATMMVACSPALAQDAGQPVQGGNLTVALFAEPTMLMPESQDINVQAIVAQLYPTLLRYDGKIAPQPYLAKAWRVSDDGKTYEFDLADGAKWSDGQPITSDDVKFSFETMIPQYQPAGKSNFGVIDSIDSSKPGTVVFKLKSPYAPFLSLMNSLYAPIVPKHIYENTDPMKNDNSLTAAVTGGPFKIKEWVKGDHLTLERNPDAFAKPNLDTVTFRFISDASARMLALKTGSVDYLPPGAVPYSSIAMLNGDASIKVEHIGDEAAGKVLTIGFNMRKAPFDNVKVRQAISHAINADFIAAAVSFKNETPAVGPLNSSSWGWDASLKGYNYDPVLAGKMLDEAGFPKQANGFRFSMTVNTRPSVEVFAKADEIVVQNLRAVGIDAKLKPMESAPYTASTYIDADFDMSNVAWISAFDPNNLGPLYACANIRPAPYSNFMAYCDKDVDDLLAKGAAEQDQAKRKAIYLDMQQRIIDDAPAVWPMNWADWSAYRVRVHGLPAGPWDSRDSLVGVWVEAK